MSNPGKLQTINLTVPPEAAGQRADKALAALRPESSRSAYEKLLEQGNVLVNGAPCGKKTVLRAGDEIGLALPAPVPLDVEPQDIPLDIVYEDDDLLIVNKPQGMVVHPAAGNAGGTLVNALLYHCRGSLSGINGVMRPGIVHRIDKDTSGLLLVAKTDRAHLSLAAQLKAHTCNRVYEAVVTGRVRQDKGEINAPVGRHPVERKRMAVTPRNSKPAVTHYEVLRRFNGYTYVRLRLETGRTHQIRVHMAHIGHPVAGDPVYGKPLSGLRGQCLHARSIGFVHPATGEYMEFTSELPDYFQNLLSKLEKSQAE
jgi:23S rRNA pseudouridine1911/1915/1917 synthase